MGDVNLGLERIGQIRENRFGSIMKVVEYIRAGDIVVEFERGNRVHTTWSSFNKGEVRNPYDRSVFGIGYIGIGKYKPNVEGRQTLSYSVWTGMMERCYSSNKSSRYPTYSDCKVTEEWHNFQNFASWFEENYYKVGNEKMELDKDIKSKGNKLYCPKLCMFVPKKINLLFVKKDAKRGNLPIGVCYYKRDKNYQADCKDHNSKATHLGRFKTPLEAFEAYKFFKECVIKKVANQYKNKIPQDLYDSLIKYQVEITD